MNQSVLYLPSSDAQYRALLEDWTAKRGDSLVLLRDAYALCVHLLRNRRLPADHVFIGTDSLLPDEHEIFLCVAATSPNSRLVALSASLSMIPDEARDHVLALESPLALRKWIESQPGLGATGSASPYLAERS